MASFAPFSLAAPRDASKLYPLLKIQLDCRMKFTWDLSTNIFIYLPWKVVLLKKKHFSERHLSTPPPPKPPNEVAEWDVRPDGLAERRSAA